MGGRLDMTSKLKRAHKHLAVLRVNYSRTVKCPRAGIVAYIQVNPINLAWQ